MNSPGKGSTRGRIVINNSSSRRARRSNSNLSSSSTSSDILVAPGPPTTSSKQPSLSGKPSALKGTVKAHIRHGRILVVKFFDRQDALQMLREMKEADDQLRVHTIDMTDALQTKLKTEDYDSNRAIFDDVDHGPNHRGTYSKAYTLQHPEIKWSHRGQGRYLPATKGVPSDLPRSHLQATGDSDDVKIALRPEGSLSRAVPPHLREGSITKNSRPSVGPKLRGEATPIPPTSSDYSATLNGPPHRPAHSRRDSHSKERPPLHRRFTEDAQTKPIGDSVGRALRAARLTGRAKAEPNTDTERRSSRLSTYQSYNESDEDSDMAGDKESTFDKQYVDAHPDEKFYHTGNGWYKRGSRPKGRVNAKHRDSEGHATMRTAGGQFKFEPGATIHVSQLDNYPGVQFHHCGNGWYKAGPDLTGHRASRIGGPVDTSADEDDEEEDEEDEDEVVDKAHTQLHPGTEWIHRGNGRYKRKSTVGSSVSVGGSYVSAGKGRDQNIYDKAYVLKHPEDEFHHRGNARYMRGPPPEHWATARRRKSAPALTNPTKTNDTTLYTKDYVDAHPEEQFHHRGQGRYARGPRKTFSMGEEGEVSGGDEGLVDTDYVNAHPNDVFHHRGQGRWARGKPPAGASNKTAVRGLGTKDSADGSNMADEDDEANKPPPTTALVLKTDGPDKWPGLQWYYRGGGKWGRITKQEFEDIQRGGPRKARGRAKMKTIDGPEAQLEREAAEAANRFGDRDDGFQVPGEMGVHGTASQGRPKFKRRRTGRRGLLQTQDQGLLSKQSSNSQSQAPTPKPRMLEPEEDILDEDDLPPLYRDDESLASEDVDNQARNLLRAVIPYRPLNPPEKFVKGLTKHDPAVRSIQNLKLLAANAQDALNAIQQEYLALEKITAPHARIPRKPAKGGRVPVEPQIFEDKKEADLYDYSYDPRRLGYQDPEAQKIQRDTEGRELRNRRNRSGFLNNNGTLPGWNFGEDEPLGPRRAVKPVNRFDGIVEPARKRVRNSNTTTGFNSKAPSMTPDRAGTPLGGPARSGYVAATAGRLTGNVPKRVRELRDDSVGVQSSKREGSPNGARKGRPPGSKNLHKRKDAGIKKGPRKLKVVDSIETPGVSDAEGDMDVEEDGYGLE